MCESIRDTLHALPTERQFYLKLLLSRPPWAHTGAQDSVAWCYAIPMPSEMGTPDTLPEGQTSLVLSSVLFILPFILVTFGQTLWFPFMQLMLRPGCQSIASSLAPSQMFPPATQLYLATCFFPPITNPKNLWVCYFFFSYLLVSTCYHITQLKQTSSRLSSVSVTSVRSHKAISLVKARQSTTHLFFCTAEGFAGLC